jgi:hypothetical protein
MTHADDRRRAAARRAVLEAHRRTGSETWVQATGGSMRPLIARGAWLRVEGGGEPRIGDVVVLPVGTRLVAHRLIARHGSGPDALLVTKGDAEAWPDPPVPARRALGVVRAAGRRPRGGASSAGLAGRPARALALVSRAAAVAAVAARDAARSLPAPLRTLAVHAARAAGRAPTELSAAALLLGARVLLRGERG